MKKTADTTKLIGMTQLVLPTGICNLGATSHVAASFEQPEYTAVADGVRTLRPLEAIPTSG